MVIKIDYSTNFIPSNFKESFVFTSGQFAFDENGSLVGKGDVRAQTRQVLQNVKAVVEEGCATLADGMKTTVFLLEVIALAAMNEVYMEF